MNGENHANSSPLAKSLKWFLATVFGAVLGLVVKHYWEAPRPVTELVSVNVTSATEQASVFVDLATVCDFMCFTSGRIKFYNKDGESSAPTNGQTFFYFGNNTKSFADEFKQYGLIMGVIK